MILPLSKDFNNVVSEMTTKLKKIGNCKYNLKDYSPWFAAIQGIQREKFIEVPGIIDSSIVLFS